MKDNKYNIAEFIFRHINGDADKKHKEEFDAWINESKSNKDLYTKINSRQNFEKHFSINSQLNTSKTWDKVDSRLQRSIRLKNYDILKYAAILFLPLCLVVFYLMQQIPNEKDYQHTRNIIPPGTNKAYLFLSDGTKLDLEKSNSGEVFSNENVSVSNSLNVLKYKTQSSDRSKELKQSIKTNEVNIPRGGEYKLILSDGTKVFLNSSTKLRFPEVFNKDKRVVYLEGEAFFQVSHNKDAPFYVITDNAKLKVYGTTFNINTRMEDVINTVLVEGSVSLSKKGCKEEYFLKPDQLGELNIKLGDFKLSDVDVYDHIAWTEGKFVFKNDRLEDILQTLCLWYDCEIFWMNKELKDIRFTGNLKRYGNINKILVSIQQTLSVRFKIKGRGITVIN